MHTSTIFLCTHISLHEEKDLKALSALPNKDGMISMLLSVLQAPMRGLACALNAVSEQK